MTSNSLKAIFLAALPFLVSTHSFYAAPEGDPQVEVIEEIIVSDFRSTSTRDLPTSVAVLDTQLIDDLSVQHFEELTQVVPNLNWSGGASRPRYFQIRGIGERSQYEGAPNPSVGFIIDDLDFSALGGIATLFDVDQIEVLRGPQGTRYGANALAGLIYVQYQKPSDIFDARVTATLGSDESRSLGTAFGGPLNDSLNYRAVFHKHHSNGFRDNAFLDRDDTNGRDETSSRLKLHYQPGSKWESELSLMHVNIDNGYDAFAVDNSLVTQSDRPGQDTQKTKGAVLSIKGDLGNSIELESITGAARSDIIFSFDADWGNNEVWSPIIYDYFSRTERDRQNLSQEFRFSSTENTRLFNGKLDWVAGAIVSNNKESNYTLDDGNFEGYTSLDTITREYDATSSAVFGDINFTVNDKTTLNTGIRYEKRNSEYTDTNGEYFDPSESSIGGQVALTYTLSPASTIYGKIARGYKAGGFNLGLPAEADNNTLLYDAEYLWNYEIGLKGLYLEDRLTVNASAFWMQRRDQHVQTSTQLDPNNPATYVFFTDNAGEGKNTGIELDANYAVSDRFSLYANLGLLNTEINNFEGASNGREQAHAPNYTYALGGHYDFNDHWFARIDASGKDDFYFSDSHDQLSQPYSLLNARLGYEQENWSVTAWGRNLLDEEYAVRGFYFGNEPAKDFADTLYIRLGDPKQIGVTVEYRY